MSKLMDELYEDEIWKPIIGYEGFYEISNYGRVRSYYKKNGRTISNIPRLLKGKVDKDGYIEYSLSNNGVQKFKRGHRLVMENFTSNPENKPQVNHIDGNKSNNHINNLEWVTQQENTLHAYKTKLSERSREVASITHGKVCRLMCIKYNVEYEFNSLSKASVFLGKGSDFLKQVKRNHNLEEIMYELGYYIDIEGDRTYERVIKK